MVGVNYVAGSLNRTKKKPPHTAASRSTPHPPPRGRPLFDRPPPNIPSNPTRAGQSCRYIDTAHIPSSSSPTTGIDDRQRGLDAYGTQTGNRNQAAPGRSGIDGITYPWAINAREVFLEERRLDEMRLKAEDERGGSGEGKNAEAAETELRQMSARVDKARREKEGEVRRGRRRWWNAYALDKGHAGGRGVEIDVKDVAGPWDGADHDVNAQSDQRRWRGREGSPKSKEATKGRQRSRDTSQTDANIDLDRHIFVDMLHQHDLLHIRTAVEPSTHDR